MWRLSITTGVAGSLIPTIDKILHQTDVCREKETITWVMRGKKKNTNQQPDKTCIKCLWDRWSYSKNGLLATV